MTRPLTRRAFQTRIARLLTGLSVLTLAAGLMPASSAHAQDGGSDEPLRFAVGPFQPTASDTRTAYEPFFKHIADELGRDYELTVTNDWAGIAIALANEQVDIAWMGPWGYVLANNEGGAEAIATVKYDGKPTYHAIILANAEKEIGTFPADAKGMSISFADVGSTSGWLIPTYWFQTQGIDPKTFFQYREGASHAANEIAVSDGQTDLATDYDRNRNVMVESGAVDPDAAKVVWTSDPLPNDPLVVRKDFDPALTQKIREIVTAITPEEAKTIMPEHYTGWVAADHSSYRMIEDAGLAVGKLQKR
ncbi:phosphate/phosphite/phosphonate ABC transporter substrate-binding protein [Fulvimarina endophytica]|uniref:Phosphate/phosphite/phosphonate ABC transporter substrate-binding protein n=1 Tax=Fulvimarina endophytica TaxID=2293836 RepID=A0A371X5C3_9HYPH|nr:phosphate/phosphite/phosphonate ABC transporter substrate-binding protein [Fulvimarina endophytica]RFC64433.1 phosphate/phosphite/phosphonate ABC transporter substrate-binding protein [Fulvimarina endophytica]